MTTPGQPVVVGPDDPIPPGIRAGGDLLASASGRAGQTKMTWAPSESSMKSVALMTASTPS